MEFHVTNRLDRLRKYRVRSHDYRPGAPPGSLDGTPAPGSTCAPPARVRLMRYANGVSFEEADDVDIADCRPPQEEAAEVVWVHLQGTPAAAQLQALGAAFGLHPLALEDVLHREARPKTEAFENQQFVVLKRLWLDADGGISSAQTSFFLGRNYLISIDEGAGDPFEPVRQRIRATGKIREHAADYLLYALTDVVIDSGFPLLEAIGDALEALEDEILDEPSQDARNRIHYAKRELVQMRRAWWPQREVVTTLMRDDEHILSDVTRLYMRDCYDHSVILIDFVETYREMASSLLDTYLSAVSQRMNDIMKALTIAATIFLPLMFITGIYGMNFDTASPWNMPELHWRYGYEYALGLMAILAIGMLAYFRRKRWL